MTAIVERSFQHAFPTVKTILIVEDDPSIGAFLQLAIEQETAHVAYLTATVNKDVQAVHHVKPHLLILDYHLCVVPGIALYDRLHTVDGLENVPALIATSSLELLQHEIAQHQLIGLAKPFDLDILLQTIETLLQRA